MEWFPGKILSGEEPFAILILNQPIEENDKIFLQGRWKDAVFRVAVDGGVNQLNVISDGVVNVPDLICGDFDSAIPEVLDYYREKGVDVVETPDQDETDFTKALRLTAQSLKNKNTKASFILAAVRNGDRLDHILGNLNTLFLASDITSLPVFIFGHKSLTWKLPPGQHKIHVTKEMMESSIGIIPLGSECNDVTTTGLKWNLNHSKMKFGGLVSNCNMFDGCETVNITTDTTLIWTMEIKPFRF